MNKKDTERKMTASEWLAALRDDELGGLRKEAEGERKKAVRQTKPEMLLASLERLESAVHDLHMNNAYLVSIIARREQGMLARLRAKWRKWRGVYNEDDE